MKYINHKYADGNTGHHTNEQGGLKWSQHGNGGGHPISEPGGH
ncbi:hypothetical protein [Bacillus arachidis]|nr:hypothetical protein [Bacillus arachidis]WIY59011.1 hypothetical protein QRY57_01205 [Bacillus arachidis]